MIRLLLVEDDNNLSYIVQTGLQDIIGGYEVITACNGKEGLEAWKEHHPDIIISDIDMPVMNGFEMVRLIRETDGDTPILFASALTSPKDVRKGYDIGPFRPADFFLCPSADDGQYFSAGLHACGYGCGGPGGGRECPCGPWFFRLV